MPCSSVPRTRILTRTGACGRCSRTELYRGWKKHRKWGVSGDHLNTPNCRKSGLTHSRELISHQPGDEVTQLYFILLVS